MMSRERLAVGGMAGQELRRSAGGSKHRLRLNLTGAPEDFDLLGRVYEFFLGEFSAMQGKAGGEQYTPRCMVTALVEFIEPFRGRVHDPCHGTGGFYIQSERFVANHAGRLDDIAIYGQERNPETYRLARMNLAMRWSQATREVNLEEPAGNPARQPPGFLAYPVPNQFRC